MPGFTFLQYDGSDERIIELITKLVGSNAGSQVHHKTPTANAVNSSNTWDDIARQFAENVDEAAASGKPSQKDAMTAWLKADGEIHLSKLWKAAGVKRQHDFSGVGGSMTKNMMKAKGPKAWYTCALDKSGEWIYKIVPELVEPLQRSFGLK